MIWCRHFDVLYSMSDREFRLDPDRIAELEGEGWRAYYDHDWLRMLRLMVRLNHEQFDMPMPAAIVAAYYTAQAGRAWAVPRADAEKTQYYLTRFYGQARAHSGLVFDPVQAGSREMAYWKVHRVRRAGGPHEEYVDRLSELHALLFNLPPERARESAEHRVRANEIVIDITEGRVPDREAAWSELKEELRRCYRSVNAERVARDGESIC